MRTCIPPTRRARPAGFTLITVLITLCILAGMVAAYGRHVIVEGRGGMASPAVLEAREACHSGLALAKQVILSGGGEVPATVPAGGGLAGLSVADLGDGHQQIAIEAMGEDGLGARRTAELASQPVAASDPTECSALPTLDAPTVDALLGNPYVTIHEITAATSLQGATLSGLYVVHPGVTLSLSDIVLKGAVVSSTVMEQEEFGVFDPALAPRLVVAGNVRIDPCLDLPGVTILMPDGMVSTSAVDARIQIHGDVVAHHVSLLSEGAIEGHVTGVEVTLASPSILDRVGFDRKAPAWSDALTLGAASEPVFLAIVPPAATLDSLAPILDYWDAN